MSAMVRSHDPGPAPGASGEHDVLRVLPASCSDERLVEGLRSGQPWARAATFDRFYRDVERTLTWAMGADDELPDLLHDVFLGAFEGIGGLTDPSRLKSWLISIAINTARNCIRKRRRRNWVFSLLHRDQQASGAEPPRIPAGEVSAATRAVLAKLSADEQVLFSLRFVARLELAEVAEACGMSIATVKRRLAGAREKFAGFAKTDPVLSDWVQGGPS
jgi:RNA polymerase sigma-70 factor, ECF subfamily